MSLMSGSPHGAAGGAPPRLVGRSRRHHLADDVAELARRLGRDGRQLLDLDRHRRAQPGAHAVHYAPPQGVRQGLRQHHLDPGQRQAFLDDLEGLHARQVAQDVDQRQAVHHGAVGGDQEVGAAALDFLQQRQSAAAAAGRRRQHADVAGAVADEGIVAAGQVGDDDLAGCAGRQRLAGRVEDLDDDVLGRDMHAAVRALVGDEAGVAAAVAVGHGAAERGGDLFALLVVEALGGDERDPDAEIVHAPAAGLRMARNVGQRRRIAEQHARPADADALDIIVQPGRRHLERRQQRCAHHAVAQRAQAVLRAQLDGRAPDHDLGVADVDLPPAGGAPLGGDIMADAFLADVEDQRLAAGAAGVEAGQAARVGGAHSVAVLADQRLVEQRQAAQVVERAQVAPDIETDLLELSAVVWHLGLSPRQQAAQALQLQRAKLRGCPVLARLQAAPHADRGVLLEPLLQREQQAGYQRGVRRAGRGPDRVPIGCSHAALPSTPWRAARLAWYACSRRGRTSTHVYCATWRRPDWRSRCASAGSASSRNIAAAIACGSRGGTNSAVASCSTRYGTPPTSVLTTGTPLASASSKELGMLSARLGLSMTSAARYSSAMAVLSSRPAKRTAAAMPSSPARRSSAARSGPAPATTRRASGWVAATMAKARSALALSYKRSRWRATRMDGAAPAVAGSAAAG